MKSEVWPRVETLFHRALAIHENERYAFLKTACVDDFELMREVQTLLESYNNPRSLMEEPIFADGVRALSAERSSLLKGKLGGYEIIKCIGSGGMGDVYLAHDPTLERYVALKLLPTFLNDDPQYVRRFQQEAHAASKISHPNVAHVYESGSEGHYYFTSMEYVEGRTLRTVLNEGTLSVPQALDIAVQVARALESAHVSGVIHRDIKPENIMIRPDGYVKVLDFGIAKLDRISEAHQDRRTQMATIVLTEPGVIMGSPAYMSPEQARGVEVDTRTDIWSLGVVLYEMLCGWTPFQGSTNIDLIAALLREEPAPISLPLRHAHPGLCKLLKRMLSKDKDQRCLTSTEVVIDLQNLMRENNSQTRLFQGSRLPFLKQQALTAYRAREGIVIKTPLPFFVMTVIVGLILTWSVRSFNRHEIETPPETQKHFERGVEAIFRDDFYTAAQELDLATKTEEYAHSVIAHARLMEVWAELDYGDKSSVSWAAEVKPAYEHRIIVSEFDSLYIHAISATAWRQFDRAVKMYQRLVTKAPDYAIAWLDLGRSYERLKRWDEAAESYRQAIARNPSFAAAFLRLGVVEGARKNQQEADKAFDRAYDLYKLRNDGNGSAEVLYQRVFLAYKLGRLDQARRLEHEASRAFASNSYQYVKHNFTLARIMHADASTAKVYEQKARNRAEAMSRVGLLFRGSDAVVVDGLLNIALLCLRDNDLMKAQPYILEASRIAGRSNLKLSMAKAEYAQAQQRLHEGFPEEADEHLKAVLRLETSQREISSQSISLWRKTIFDRDYDDVINEFKPTTNAVSLDTHLTTRPGP